MKKLLLILAIFAINITSKAQFSVVGSKEYGRLVDVTYDEMIPDKVYAATLGNHIVTSGHNGQSWQILYSHEQKGHSIRNLRYLNGNKLSFITFIPGAHCNKVYVLDLATLSLEQSYEIPLPDCPESNIQSYAIMEGNMDVALVQQSYLSGSNMATKVYYTNDGGDTWDEVYDSTGYNNRLVQQVAISPTDDQKLIMTRAFGDGNLNGGILVSEDAGAIWNAQLTGIDMGPIAIDPSDPDHILAGTLAFAYAKGLYRSLDGGASWTMIINLFNEMPNGPNFIQFDPTDPDNAIVLGANEVLRTENAFETWETDDYPSNIQNVNNYYFGTYASYNPFTNKQVFISASDYPLFTDDGGDTFVKADNPFFMEMGNVNLYAGAEPHLYYGVQFGYVHQDLQTTEETPHFTIPIQLFPNFNSTHFADNNVSGRTYTFTSAVTGGVLVYSDNHGEDYFSVNSEYQFMHAITSHALAPNKVWASLSDGSTNGGVVRIYDISNPANVLQTTLELPVPGVVSKIIIAPDNTNHMVIVLKKQVFSSIDNGVTWQEIMDMPLIWPDDKILDVVFNPSNPDEIIAATNQGLYKSFNAGVSFIPIADFFAHRIWYSPETPENLVAVTYDHSLDNTILRLRFSNDGGVSWVEVADSQLYYINCSAAAPRFLENSVSLYLGTFDVGIVKYDYVFGTLNTNNPELASPAVRIYPNPGNESISLYLNGETMEKAGVFSMTGQKLMEVTQPQHINIAGLPSGIYLVKVSTSSGKNETLRFVKN